nr:hypothetical protein [uncultured Campylobacter sp.]
MTQGLGNSRIPTLNSRISKSKLKRNSKIPILNSKIPRKIYLKFPKIIKKIRFFSKKKKTLKFLRILTIYFTQIGKDATVCSHRFITPKS